MPEKVAYVTAVLVLIQASRIESHFWWGLLKQCAICLDVRKFLQGGAQFGEKLRFPKFDLVLSGMILSPPKGAKNPRKVAYMAAELIPMKVYVSVAQ